MQNLEPEPAIRFTEEKNGVVYTKPWAIDLILDLVGYTSDCPLHLRRIIDPAAGDGAFLQRIVPRLIESCRRHGVSLAECKEAVEAYEFDDESTLLCRSLLTSTFLEQGLSAAQAQDLASAWVVTRDYLLQAQLQPNRADYVVGNLSYIRLEHLPEDAAQYHSLYKTTVGQADICGAFYEAALGQLRTEGICGFICADRWMFDQHGAELRNFITLHYAIDAILQIHRANAPEQEVKAYPAITILRNGTQKSVMVANLEPKAEPITAADLSAELVQSPSGPKSVVRIDQWFEGNFPWPLIEPDLLALLGRIEANFLPLEQTGATVGIGIATGADKIFITRNPKLVEADRLLPLALSRDARDYSMDWSGHYLVNPWDGESLAKLEDYPQLARYFKEHEVLLRDRHVSKKNPSRWYRTIDKVNVPLTRQWKLYLPDFKGRVAPVLDRGKTYPHHNLFYITSGHWDMGVLGGLLMSDVAQFFIQAYGVKMQGGYFRFQAQHLRRICVPFPEEITPELAQCLSLAFENCDVQQANEVAVILYSLTPEERNLIMS